MTDLIKRDDALNACILREDNPPTEMQLSLRNVISALPAVDRAAIGEAALQARIEELEKQCSVYARSDRFLVEEIKELEAKLTEAVAGLRKIADYKHFSRDQGWIQITEARIASATLAKLEGKK